MGAWNGGEVKRCGCGLVHDERAWKALELVGTWDDGEEVFELRNCRCGSSIAIVIGPSTGAPPILAGLEAPGFAGDEDEDIVDDEYGYADYHHPDGGVA